MDKKDFLKTYNDLQVSKKAAAASIKLYILSCTIIIIACFIWMYESQKSFIDKVKVVDIKGDLLHSETTTLEKLKKSLIEAQCEKAVYYANTFSRNTLNENRAKTRFLINERDANKIFETYLKSGKYSDAVQRGYNFESNYIKLISMDISKEPYQVQFVSEFTVNDGQHDTKYIITSSGEIVNTTPQYPENPFGLFFKRYEQDFKLLKDEN